MSEAPEVKLPVEPREARFQWGQPVTATIDLVNDGSYPDLEADVLIVAQGSRGEIVQVGHHVEANVPVYLVEFREGCVVGCLEEEIAPV